MKPTIKKIIKRNGKIVAFSQEKIINAIHKAMIASHEGRRLDAKKVSTRVLYVLQKLTKQNKDFVANVELIQDIVEMQLMLNHFPKTAKTYILYRQKRQRLRKQRISVSDKLQTLAKQSNQYFQNSLSQVVYLRTYARWIEEENRRETWVETVNRYMDFMHQQLKNKLSAKEYHEIKTAILKQEIMPSMRLMQFAGPAAASTPVCTYNCAYIAPTTLEDFGEVMYISMCGCGVGFSVESQNIQTLPIIKKQSGKKEKPFVIPDTREGWCQAFVLGLKTWYQGKDIEFDFSKLRPLGVRLKTFGGHSSGPDPLRALLEYSRNKILDNQGRRLTNIEVHDILCKIGEVVLSGGVRRSAMISLSDLDDQSMRDAKKGQFYYAEPQRSFANNSAVYENKPNNETLLEEWLALIKSRSGERGIFNRGFLQASLPKKRLQLWKQKGLIKNNEIVGMIGTNPCGEIILQSKQFCNLSEVIARTNDTEKSLLRKIRLATIVGTYQATLTRFPFLSKEWQRNCEQEALLGVSITGHWDCPQVRNPDLLKKLKQQTIKYNKIYAKRFAINPAAAVTCIKPSGTVSLVVDSAAGIHPRYATYYIRRIRIAATDALCHMLKDQGIPYHPEVGYATENSPSFVFDFPVASPKKAIVRNDLSAADQLAYWLLVKSNYTEHNPSVTISVDTNEWIGVLNWIDQHWDVIGGLSFLPKFRDIYQLAPFEEITKQQYEQLLQQHKNIDFSKLPIYEQEIGSSAGESDIQMGPSCE